MRHILLVRRADIKFNL